MKIAKKLKFGIFQNFLKLKMVKMKLTFKIFGLNKKQLKIDKY